MSDVLPAHRNAVRKAMASKQDRIADLQNDLVNLGDRYQDKCREFDALCVRYEDETGHEWDGLAFATSP